ncbi:MAG: hypothetical protein RR054_00935 [Clostridia bacterium]
MVQETVKSIVEAEQAAELIVEQAKAEAARIMLKGENDAEILRAQGAQLRKSMLKQRDAAAMIQGDKEAQKTYEDGKVMVDKANAVYRKNYEKAVKYIVGSIE